MSLLFNHHHGMHGASSPVETCQYLASLADIAAYFRGLWACETCGGSGTVTTHRPGRDPAGIDREYEVKCPSCAGRGWLPPEEAPETLIEAIEWMEKQ